MVWRVVDVLGLRPMQALLKQFGLTACVAAYFRGIPEDQPSRFSKLAQLNPSSHSTEAASTLHVNSMVSLWITGGKYAIGSYLKLETVFFGLRDQRLGHRIL